VAAVVDAPVVDPGGPERAGVQWRSRNVSFLILPSSLAGNSTGELIRVGIASSTSSTLARSGTRRRCRSLLMHGFSRPFE